MFTNFPHPILSSPPRILALQPTKLHRENTTQPCSASPPPPLLLTVATLAHRYQTIFPEFPEWQTDTFAWQAPDAEARLAEMVETFLGRIDHHRFPVMDEMWEMDLALSYHHLQQIPLFPQGIEPYWYDDPAEQPEPFALLLHLECRTFDEDGTDTLATAYPQYTFPSEFSLSNIYHHLHKTPLPEPLNGLLDAIDLVKANTDNPLLDYSYGELCEMGSNLHWDEETVDWLTTLWRAAKPKVDRAWALVAWCRPKHDDPEVAKVLATERLDELVNILLDLSNKELPHDSPTKTPPRLL